MQEPARVAMLRPVEGVCLDPACLTVLREGVGATRAARIMEKALQDMALGLARMAAAYREDRFSDLIRESIAIGQSANRLGLDRLARVAFTVAALARGNDGVALSANIARLMRLGNDALGMMWNMQDQIV